MHALPAVGTVFPDRVSPSPTTEGYKTALRSGTEPFAQVHELGAQNNQPRLNWVTWVLVR